VVAAVTVEPVIVDPVTADDIVVVYWGDVVIAVGDVVAVGGKFTKKKRLLLSSEYT